MRNAPGSQGGAPDGGAPGSRAPLPSWNRGRTKKRGSAPEDEEDAFQRGMRQGSSAARKQWQLVAIGGVAAIGILLASMYVMKQSTAGKAETTRKLAQAAAVGARGIVVPEDQLPEDLLTTPPDPIFTSEDARAEALTTYLAELGDAEAKAPELTALLRAAASLRAGEHQAARDSYEVFLAASDADHPLRFIGVEGRGVALENLGELDAALVAYEELAGRKGSFYRDMALWHQGRVLEALDRREDAIAVYRTYVTEFPAEVSSIAREEVRERLEQLDPEALKAPAPPAAPEAAEAAPEAPTQGE